MRFDAAHRRGAAAAAATACLVAGGLSTAPATAASAALVYTCTVPAVGAKTFTVSLDTDAADSIAFGEKITPALSASLTIPEDLANSLRGLQAKKASGSSSQDLVVDGVTATVAMTIKESVVPPNGPIVLDATGTLAEMTGKRAGTPIAITAANLTATLTFTQANGTPAFGPVTVPCTLNPGQNPVVDSIAVTKDATKTVVRAPNIAKGKVAKARIKVTSEHGVVPVGKVKAILKRGSAKVMAVKAKLVDGKVKVPFKALRKAGKYTVVAKYLGSRNLVRSKASTTFMVS